MADFYRVYNEETGFEKDVYTIPRAKKLMKEENAKCEKWFVWFNGERYLKGAIDKKGNHQPISFNKL